MPPGKLLLQRHSLLLGPLSQLPLAAALAIRLNGPGPVLLRHHDGRITRVGPFLRYTLTVSTISS